MNGLFAFDRAPWEETLERLPFGDSIAAAELLALMEGEEEYALEDALQLLENGGIALDITGLPRLAAAGEAAVRLKQEEALSGGDLMSALEEGDPLRLYLEELAAIPACGDVNLLAMDAASGSERARTALGNLMLSRVVELARGYVGRGVLLMDLIQEGGMGMWQGILNWNGEGRFEDRADWWIRQYLARAVTLQARASGVGQRMRQAMEDYRAVDERLLSDLGRNPTLEEIAQALHMSLEETGAVRDMLVSARRMDKVRAPEPEETPEEEDQAVEDTAAFRMRQRILDLLSALDAGDQKLLTLRFGLEGGKPLTPEETGRKLGLSPAEVVARETAALAKLRNV